MSTKSSPSILKRFTGKGGRLNLVNALCRQILIGGNQEIARALAKHTLTRQIRSEHELIRQGAPDNDIYFILSGSCSIRVNNREVAIRSAGEHVGEMALLDTTSVRSATATTIDSTVVGVVSEVAFTRIANRYPELWRRMATTLAERLKQRSRFHASPRSESAVFIGSSGEGVKVAEHINRYLGRLPFVPRLWSHGVFECSKTTIESLMEITNNVDFAILVLTSDDVTRSRGRSKASPRDNVVFELGLFMGALGRKRTYIIAKKGVDLKIPTDLLAVTYLSYTLRRGRTLAKNLKGVLQEIRTLIESNGPI